jgi:hypothetical protein
VRLQLASTIGGTIPISDSQRGSKRVLSVEIVDASGNQITSFGSSTVSISQVTPGTGATDLGKAEDAIHASGDVGVQMLGVRRDTLAAGAANGDYESLPIASISSLIGVPVHVVGISNLFCGGIDAHNASITGNPILQGFVGSTGAPTSVTSGNVVRGWADLSGRLHITGDGSMSPILSAGDIANDGVDSGNPLKIGGKATTRTSIPTAVSANNDRVDGWFDLNGAQIVRGGFRTTYVANYRLTTRAYALSNAFAGAGVKQYATIYHAASATKTVRIRSVRVWLKNCSAAVTVMVELRRLSATTAPATGNPAITPLAHNTSSSAAEATCLALPTTAGSEAAANAGWGNMEIALGITGAASTVNPIPTEIPVILYEDDGLTEVEPLIMRSGVAEGYAIMVDASAAATITATCQIIFSEE